MGVAPSKILWLCNLAFLTYDVAKLRWSIIYHLILFIQKRKGWHQKARPELVTYASCGSIEMTFVASGLILFDKVWLDYEMIVHA